MPDLVPRVRKRRAARWQILLYLCERTDRNPTVPVSLAEIAGHLDLSIPETLDHVLYLRLIVALRYTAPEIGDPYVNITARGIRKVEEALDKPERSIHELGSLDDAAVLTQEQIQQGLRTTHEHRRRQAECLYWMYRFCDGAPGVSILESDLSLMLGTAERSVHGCVHILENRGLLAEREKRVTLTAQGMYEVEELLLHPTHDRIYFPSAQRLDFLPDPIPLEPE